MMRVRRSKRHPNPNHKEAKRSQSLRMKKTNIGDKKELDKMYQAMKYQAKKGNNHPLEKYNNLTTKAEKQDFYNKYLKDKKFERFDIEEKNKAEKIQGERTRGVDEQVPGGRP